LSTTKRVHHLTFVQAAESLESFKMESPLKQPVFLTTEDKENIERDEVAVPVKGIPLADEPESEDAVVVAQKEDEGEPILKENPNRFVLFPIKYHEVGL